ncbi:MAG TPA: malto-oligosyltrehalose trehalohydrolase [Gammaproteobacteria bacterium]
MAIAKRRHRMPFGAEPTEEGHVRFRLWAPAARRVDVCIGDRPGDSDTGRITVPMTPEPGGWFGCTTALARIGTRYRYRIDGGDQVPDPASRFQPDDVHGPSEVIDPHAWSWRDTAWRGRPWEEAVIYELHVGSFTPRGTFAAVAAKLDYLAGLGVTAIELMPVADFPGARNWGYDGTCLFAPDSRYGRPEDLKSLVDAAHARGLMVFLDVVYNHFGPEGNYLHRYAPQFFTQRHTTPWGAAINYDGDDSYWVRQFVVHNALYWLKEYHFDGLRLDAVHAIADESRPDILTQLAERVQETFADSRQIHLVLENDDNAARYLSRDAWRLPERYTAQWNDDIHHALHVLLTGETAGYFADYSDAPLRHLARCLVEGFAYQGERSSYRDGRPRGESSRQLPVTAFVAFLQNHDQIGNRAFGERIGALCEAAPLRAATALLLLAPSPPLLFMGQEWNCVRPFPFFCDFGPELADAVVEGRRGEFARFPQFSDPEARARIPDPMDIRTFEAAVLDWRLHETPRHAQSLQLHRDLLDIRRRELFPRLRGLPADADKGYTLLGAAAFRAHWTLNDGSVLVLLANLGDEAFTDTAAFANAAGTDAGAPVGRMLYATHPEIQEPQRSGRLPPWSVFWRLCPQAADA